MTPVPPLEPPAEPALPATTDHRLPGGLRVLAVHRTGVPLMEIRLRVPFASAEPGHDARSRVLAETLLAGTDRHDRIALSEELQDLGAIVKVTADGDQLLVSAVVLVRHLAEFLTVLAEVLTGATYPDGEVAAERTRMVQRLRMARSKASVRARETLRRHLYGSHPYGRDLPDLVDVAAVTADDLRALHARRVRAAGSDLILVGAALPDDAVRAAAEALAIWDTPPAGSAPADVEPLPELPALVADPSLLVDRPGSVQSSIRIGGPALRRDDPRYAALQLANLLYGGYFSSRLVANVREDKGYTYTPRSRIDHGSAGSTLLVEADVATEVTAPALLEVWYELGRLSTLRPTDTELADARQYAVGTLMMSIATQSGLASTLVALAGTGLDLDWVRTHPARLAEVTARDIYDMGVHILAPCRLAAVVIGDATATAEPLQAFGPWEVRS